MSQSSFGFLFVLTVTFMPLVGVALLLVCGYFRWKGKRVKGEKLLLVIGALNLVLGVYTVVHEIYLIPNSRQHIESN